MVAYRLRIELPDRPGSLAGVTAEIAASGANITSIDVHELDGNMAVDEIVVEVGESWAPGPVAAALAASGVGTLLSSRRMTAVDDGVTAALRSIAAMVDGDVMTECRAALLALAHGSSAKLVPPDSSEPAARVAVERRTSIVSRIDHGWVLAAIDDPVEPSVVTLVTRPLNVRFSATEVARVEALLRLLRVLPVLQRVDEGG